MDGRATAWDVKQYLRPQIVAWRAKGWSWKKIQDTLGPYAWHVWLMVENVPPQQESLRAAIVTDVDLMVI